MKKRGLLCVSFILFVIITLAIVISYKQINNFKVPEVKNIKTIGIVPPKVGSNSGDDELFFNLDKKEHLDMVNTILNWLKSGKIIGKTNSDIIYHGSAPTYLIIDLKDGTQIRIQSATDAIATDKGNELYMESKDVPGEITLYFDNDNKKPIRELSPQLKSFINDGWKSFFNNSQK